jgi:1-aminocyclopropane-1-carboxylate deaminase/D-cysteine desulfhydrase-like pyridoxal-dependent ACC family enzyme
MSGASKHKQDDPFERVHHGRSKFSEVSYIGSCAEIFTKTHEKQGFSVFYDVIVINQTGLLEEAGLLLGFSINFVIV